MSTGTENDIADKIYEKKVTCPVCSNEVSVIVVKSKCIRIESREPDFMIRYKDPNPMYYDVWLCNNCGYAANSSRFEEIADKERDKIKKSVTSRWTPRKEYPFPYTVNTAIELHKLALVTSMVREELNSEKAHLCLKLGWLYRLKGDSKNEHIYIKHSLEQFLKAYECEDLPIAGLDGPSLMYLIGELYRRLDDNANARKWFSMVLVNKEASPRIKDMAREQKDLMKQDAAAAAGN